MKKNAKEKGCRREKINLAIKRWLFKISFLSILLFLGFLILNGLFFLVKGEWPHVDVQKANNIIASLLLDRDFNQIGGSVSLWMDFFAFVIFIFILTIVACLIKRNRITKIKIINSQLWAKYWSIATVFMGVYLFFDIGTFVASLGAYIFWGILVAIFLIFRQT